MVEKEAAGLCDEMLAMEILSRLPIKTLFRFKCVCKRWSSFIELMFIESNFLSSNMLGLFYQEVGLVEHRILCRVHQRQAEHHIFHTLHDNDPNPHNNCIQIDTSLTFLPLRFYPEIVDSCNGLLLCRPLPKEGFTQKKTLELYYVCNPITRRWDSLPSLAYNNLDIARIAFDPHVSPHYKVLLVKHCVTHAEFYIFSSQNRGCQWQKLISLQPIIELDTYGRCRSVFSNGALYLTSSGRNRYHIVRFKPLEGTSKTIMLPPGYDARPFIGILQSSICCGELFGPRLRIWKLVEHEQDDATSSWVLKHDITVAQFQGRRCSMAFHPFSEVVFVKTREGLWSYNLDGSSTTAVKVSSEGIKIQLGVVLPFSPCYIDVLKGKKNIQTWTRCFLIKYRTVIKFFVLWIFLGLLNKLFSNLF